MEKKTRLREYNGFLWCKKDWFNKFNHKCFSKGKTYDVECIGVCDQALELAVISDDYMISTFILWGEEEDNFEEHFDWIDGSEEFEGLLVILSKEKI